MVKIDNPLFYCKNKDTYPPFKNGQYLEEYFFNYIIKNKIEFKRTYIPALWTNFQIEGWFNSQKENMQRSLDDFITKNPNPNGYFTIVQYDDGPLLKLPKDTIVFGACSGNIPMPLIYEDKLNLLESQKSLNSYDDRPILCSFVGTLTHNVRRIILGKYHNNNNFFFDIQNGWTPSVKKDRQDNFISATNNSKFALAPRGYGRSSFRFFEIFKLNCIPVYVWDDIEWLPYKDILDYSKFCISININEIDKLENILLNINEEKYKSMLDEYNKIKNLFYLDGMTEYIINFNLISKK